MMLTEDLHCSSYWPLIRHYMMMMMMTTAMFLKNIHSLV